MGGESGEQIVKAFENMSLGSWVALFSPLVISDDWRDLDDAYVDDEDMDGESSEIYYNIREFSRSDEWTPQMYESRRGYTVTANLHNYIDGEKEMVYAIDPLCGTSLVPRGYCHARDISEKDLLDSLSVELLDHRKGLMKEFADKGYVVLDQINERAS